MHSEYNRNLCNVTVYKSSFLYALAEVSEDKIYNKNLWEERFYSFVFDGCLVQIFLYSACIFRYLINYVNNVLEILFKQKNLKIVRNIANLLFYMLATHAIYIALLNTYFLLRFYGLKASNITIKKSFFKFYLNVSTIP